MKKISIALVVLLSVLMLVAGCENKPKERAATTEDIEVVTALSGAALKTNSDNLLVAVTKGVTIEKTESGVVYRYDDVDCGGGIVINGKSTVKDGIVLLDLKSGTKIADKGHTLYVKFNVKSGEYSGIVLDGDMLTAFKK